VQWPVRSSSSSVRVASRRRGHGMQRYPPPFPPDSNRASYGIKCGIAMCDPVPGRTVPPGAVGFIGIPVSLI